MTGTCRNRLLFTALGVLLFVVLVEGLSYLTYWAAFGAPISWSRVRDQQRSLAEQGHRQLVSDLLNRDGPIRHRPHPFAGTMPAAKDWELTEDVVFVNDPSFYQPDAVHFQSERNTLVVGITGGSVSALFARESTPRLARKLREDHRFSTRPIRFISLGFGGFKQPQQLSLLNYLVSLGVQFDFLLNIDGFNEFALTADILHRGLNYSYPRNWGVDALSAPDTLPVVGRVAYARFRRLVWARRSLSSWCSWSMTRALLWKWRDHLLAAEIASDEATLSAYSSQQQNFALTGPPNHFADEADLRRQLADLWSRCSRMLHETCRSQSIKYLHFLQPNQYFEGSKPLSNQEKRVAVREDHPYGRNVQAAYPELQRLGANLRSGGVPFYDLTQIFAEVRETVYKDDCCHLNQHGNELLADAIADIIFATG